MDFLRATWRPTLNGHLSHHALLLGKIQNKKIETPKLKIGIMPSYGVHLCKLAYGFVIEAIRYISMCVRVEYAL